MLSLALSFQLLTFSPSTLSFRLTRLPLDVQLNFAGFLPRHQAWKP